MSEQNGAVIIDKRTFFDAVGYSMREYLRDKLNDPKSGDRDPADKFVWFSKVDAVLGKDEHEVPFIAISKADGNSDDLGHDNQGAFKRGSYTIQLVYESAHNADLIDQAVDLLAEIDNDQGSGPDYDYDFSPCNSPDHTGGPTDRDQYSDHQHNETAADFTIRAAYGG